MNTHNVISTPDITGNIGSCSVSSSNYRTGFFTKETTVVNSCSGQIVSQNEYFSGTFIWVTFAIVLFVLFMTVAND